MTDEEGGVGGEREAKTVDWRVRACPRNKPTARERGEHEATHMPFRDWCTHCIMGRGRTHHHVAKQKSDAVARRQQNHQVPCGELHARRTPRRLPNLAVVGETCGGHFVQVPEGSRQSKVIRKVAWQGACKRVCAIRRKGASKTNIIRTVVAGSEKHQC